MKAMAGLMVFLMTGPVFAAETYRWVDDKGVVNYGEKPPAGRQAVRVDTVPGGVIETGGQFSQKAAAEQRRSMEEPPRQPVFAVPTPAPSAESVRGMEFDVYIRLQRGMTEGELLLRAGRPDHQSLDNLIDDISKTYYYFPTSANPYTTVVTLRGGRIFELDRIKRF
jgi:hypothetical protein